MSLDDQARDLVARAEREEWLTGPPLRLRELCEMTGFSKMKFLADIDRGELTVKRVRTGQRSVIIIERTEALRYLSDIGFAA